MTGRPLSAPNVPALAPDPEIAELIPEYVRRRRDELPVLRRAIDARDWSTVRLIGHRSAGHGVSFGFDEISRIGRALERAALEGRAEEALRLVDELEGYVRSVQDDDRPRVGMNPFG
ncbi:Hpt domain-containing protein [Candidatus Nitrospira bockiana]